METFHWVLMVLAISGLSIYAIYMLYKFIQLYTVYKKHSPEQSKHQQSFDLMHEYHKYLHTVNPYMYRVKLPSTTTKITKITKITNKTQFINTYLQYVHVATKEENELLMKKCVQVDKILDSYKLHKLRNIRWKFMISHPDLELGFPYTIGDFIIVPRDMLPTITTETLLHEKIHIYQRKYPEECRHLYQHILPFAHHIDKNAIAIPKEILQTKMTNPDENGEIWIYHYKGRWYYPSLQMGMKNRTEQIGYQVDVGKRPMEVLLYNTIPLKKMSTFDGYPPHISVYHPHEIFACILAHQLISGHTISKELEKKLNLESLY